MVLNYGPQTQALFVVEQALALLGALPFEASAKVQSGPERVRLACEITASRLGDGRLDH